MTLKEYEVLGGIIALRRLCLHAGIDYNTMTSRVRRGSPEVTADEEKQIRKALRKFGLIYDQEIGSVTPDEPTPDGIQ